jgi:CTP:molybdopterin cytidylyltransferase MocA
VSGIATVVLAAGASTRYGTPKQRVLLPEVLTRLEASLVDEIVVVEGAYELRNALSGRARLVHCAEWERGPGASLRCGLAALGADVEAAVVVLADGPRLPLEALARVIQSWRDEGGDVVAASYGGVRGHPLLLARSRWDAVPDDGLRVVSPRLVSCDDLGFPGDVDTPADLEALNADRPCDPER